MRIIIYKGYEYKDYTKYYDKNQINIIIGARHTGKSYSFIQSNSEIANIEIISFGANVEACMYRRFSYDKRDLLYWFSVHEYDYIKKGVVIIANTPGQVLAFFSKFNITLEDDIYEKPITIE